MGWSSVLSRSIFTIPLNERANAVKLGLKPPTKFPNDKESRVTNAQQWHRVVCWVWHSSVGLLSWTSPKQLTLSPVKRTGKHRVRYKQVVSTKLNLYCVKIRAIINKTHKGIFDHYY